jgi:hypothetical protein
MDTSHEDVQSFLRISGASLARTKHVGAKVVDANETHISSAMHSVRFAVYEITEMERTRRNCKIFADFKHVIWQEP